MTTTQQEYDDAMFDFSRGEYDSCIERLSALLTTDPSHFDAQLSLGMAYYRKGDFARAIAEGHKAESIRPKEQLVHTNLSLFYMKSGDKQKAEHHGLQARIASWREDKTPPGTTPPASPDPDLSFVKSPSPPAVKPPKQFPDMPWKKNRPSG